MKLGYIVGRFNILHNGHIEIIRKMITQSDVHIIFIGSSNVERTFKNPFSFKERKRVIKNYFPNSMVVNMPDMGDDLEWSKLLNKKINKVLKKLNIKNCEEINMFTSIKDNDFDLRNSWVNNLGHNVKGVKIESNLSATLVRDALYRKELHKLENILDNYIINFLKEKEHIVKFLT